MKPILALALPLIFAAGCRNQFPSPDEAYPHQEAYPRLPVNTVPVERPVENDTTKQETVLKATAKTSKASYKSGETVEFIITLKNTSNKPQPVEFSSGQNFDVTVTPEGAEKPIWRWADGRFFTLAIRNEVLQAGEEKTWTAKWDQQTQNAEGEKSPAPRGRYIANATVTIMGGLNAAPVKFTLAE
jgi:hypothetical protein